MYCQLTGNIWFVEAGPLAGGVTGGKVVIMSPRAWMNRQLAKPIQIARKDEPLEVVVADLRTHASGIRFVPEPGLYQSVPLSPSPSAPTTAPSSKPSKPSPAPPASPSTSATIPSSST